MLEESAIFCPDFCHDFTRQRFERPRSPFSRTVWNAGGGWHDPCGHRRGHFPLSDCPETGQEGIAFAVTAVDCAGPYKVKRGRTFELFYMLLFTCCRVRAVKIEWLSNLSVGRLLDGLVQSGSSWVSILTLSSADNGGNFESANRLLRLLWQSMPQEQLEMRKPQIKWRFNPPYASHFGGVFERLIGAAKQALYHALPSHEALTLERAGNCVCSCGRDSQLQTTCLCVYGSAGSPPTDTKSFPLWICLGSCPHAGGSFVLDRQMSYHS